jgi:hypothetical protein
MKKYNKIELFLAKELGNFPRLKSISKELYGRINYLIFKEKYRSWTSKNYKLNSLHCNFETFFGYYDKSPENNTGFILAHISKHPTSKKVDPSKPIQVALFNENGEKIWSKETLAYNWQQGARLHWINDNLFIYNVLNKSTNQFNAEVISLDSLTLYKTFEFPVQDSYRTDYFLSINYETLQKLRPDYGYLKNKNHLNKMKAKYDGIIKVDFESGKFYQIVPLDTIIKFEPKKDFENSKHWINHVMISPNGKQFIFLHRYLNKGKRIDRLILACSHSGKLKLLNDYGMISHCCWVDDNKLLGYMRGVDGKDSYKLITLEKLNKIEEVKELDNLNDGHPTIHKTNLVTDTYPDRSRLQNLLLYSIKTKQLHLIGKFHHSFRYRGINRCDLHPRFSPQGDKIYFDSVYTGIRKLYYININEQC